MSFFPPSYFSPSYFGGGDQEEQPGMANMAAILSGHGQCTAGIIGTAAITGGCPGHGDMTGTASLSVTMAAAMAGLASLQGDLGADDGAEQPQPENGGWWSDVPYYQAPRHVVALAAHLSGYGQCTAGITGTAAITGGWSGHGDMTGTASLNVARPVIDITGLLRRRREEEAIMALLLAVV